MPQDLTSELLKFFQATNLGTYQGVACSFGTELINALAASGYAPLPAAVEQITAAHVHAYLNAADPETLERNLNILKLMTLKIKIDPQDEALCVQTPIRIAQKATVVPTYHNLHDFRNLLNTFDNNTLRTLTSDIEKRLAKSQRTKTRQAMLYLQTMEVHEPTVMGLAKGFGTYFAEVLNPMPEHLEQHAKDVAANPGIKLEPQDFVNYSGKHKKLMLEKIILLKGMHDVPGRNGQPVNLFATFNRAARNILKQYKPGLNAAQVEKLDVKIDLLLKRLAGVLKQHQRNAYADEIYAAIDGQVLPKFEFAGLFKKNISLKDPAEIVQKANELFVRIVGALNNGTFMSKLFGRVDVPEKVQQFVGAEFPGVDVAANLQAFVQRLENNPDATEARRRFLNRYTKVVEAYAEAERMDVAVDKLTAAGVVAGDADLQDLDNVPLLSGFELVKQNLAKLVERTDDQVREDKPKKYLDVAALQPSRDQELNSMQTEMQKMQAWVLKRLRLLAPELAKLPDDLAHADAREQYEEVQQQLEELGDKLNPLVAAPANGRTGQELINAQIQAEECRTLYSNVRDNLSKLQPAVVPQARAVQQALAVPQAQQAIQAQLAELMRIAPD